jgi:zinc transporter ZupT
MSVGISEVFWLSLAMFVSTTAIGLLPLFCNISQKFMRFTNIFGAGLLVGAAFIIIVPEGVGTLIGSYTKVALDTSEKNSHKIDSEALSHNDAVDVHALGNCVGLSLVAGFILMLLVDECSSSKHSHNEVTS